MRPFYTLTLLLMAFAAQAQTIGLQSFATGFDGPVEITNAGDQRLFVVEQGGKIRIVSPAGVINTTPFLDLTAIVNQTAPEGGLLGLAFHPDYASNGFFYVNYTNTAGHTVIARYSVSANPDIASTVASVILTINQPFQNHNGGTLRFGPDGFLYIGMGDGGSGGDPGNRAQNITELLGKMLRIDVNGTAPYTSPPSNPYVGVAGADEIWAIGLRNPWKFSFDAVTGDLWIADVGQENVEEINKAGSTLAGLNYGWRCYEGNNAYLTAGCLPAASMTFPFSSYSSATGSGNCSITGGYVYRGSTYPNFVGKYFFADYCSNKIGMLTAAGVQTFSPAFSGNNFTTFGVDNNNALYIAGGSNGTVYKVIDSSLGISDLSGLQFSIAPNPVAAVFSIRLTDAAFPVKVQLFDLIGKKVSETMMVSAVQQVETGSTVRGMYLLQLQDANGKTGRTKLLLQ